MWGELRAPSIPPGAPAAMPAWTWPSAARQIDLDRRRPRTMTLFTSIFIALISSMLLVPVLIRWSVQLHLLDLPDARKVHAGAIPRSGGVAIVVGAAIPIANAMPFLKSHIPDLSPSADQPRELDWPGVDAKVSPSTVLILKKENLRGDIGVGKR